MSRSRKKNPWCCDRNPWAKKYANRRLRRNRPRLDNHEDWIEPFVSGNSYRKYSCSYDICDWRWAYTLPEYIESHTQWQMNWVRMFPNSRLSQGNMDEWIAGWTRDWHRFHSRK